MAATPASLDTPVGLVPLRNLTARSLTQPGFALPSNAMSIVTGCRGTEVSVFFFFFSFFFLNPCLSPKYVCNLS